MGKIIVFISVTPDGFAGSQNVIIDEEFFEFTHSLLSLEQYRQAGADGLFVTGVQDIDIIQRISAGSTLPLTIVATPKLDSYELMKRYGVKRISMAVFLYSSTYRHMETIAGNINNEGSFLPLHRE